MRGDRIRLSEVCPSCHEFVFLVPSRVMLVTMESLEILARQETPVSMERMDPVASLADEYVAHRQSQSLILAYSISLNRCTSDQSE